MLLKIWTTLIHNIDNINTKKLQTLVANLQYIEEDEGFLSNIISQFTKIETYRNSLLVPSNKLLESYSFLSKSTFKTNNNKSHR